MKRTKYFQDSETRQLRQNIKKSIGTAATNAFKVWLRMIREVNECEQEQKKDTLIQPACAQSIIKFFGRQARM